MRVFLDPGHGGTDPGAVYGGIREADVNLDISIWLRQALIEAGCRDCDVIFSRENDMTVPLHDRVRLAAEFKADIFLSIHCDASENPEARGQSVFIFREVGVAGLRLGKTLEKALMKKFPERKQRGLSRANFFVLRKSPCPAALVECEFLSNPDGRAFLQEAASQQALAAALAAGLMAWHEGLS